MQSWYGQLLLPITLNAAVFNFQSREVYVFGFYEGSTSIGNLPYRFVNCIDVYDKLLLDNVNFERMGFLPPNLQSLYASKYFKMSRLPSMKLKQIYYSDFTRQNLFSRYKIKKRLIRRNVTNFQWDSDVAMHQDLLMNINNLLSALASSSVKQFEAHELNLGRVKAEVFEMGHHCKPNYVASNHWQSASKISGCKWCDVRYVFRNIDWRMETMYNELMSFIQSCYKSNINAGHCSSIENIYPLVKNLIWHSITKYVDQTIGKLFETMQPIVINDQRMINFHWQMDISLYTHIKLILGIEALPFALNIDQFGAIIKGIINQWCDYTKLRPLPLCIEFTNTLIDLEARGKLSEEYELLISDSEDDE